MNHEIQEEKYQITHDPDQAVVHLRGALLLNGAVAYEPILELLQQAAESHEPNPFEVDIRGLTFLNSSGINMMTKFVMYVSEVKGLTLKVTLVGKKHIAWQERLSVNLTRLMPTLATRLEEQ